MAARGPVFRRMIAGSVAVVALLTTSCSMTIQAVEAPPTAAVTTLAATPSPVPSPTFTPTDTPTPAPTASPTPDMTATAGAMISGQWSAATQQIVQIDSALTTIGTRFQNGSVGLTDAAGQLRQLDQQAGAAAQTVDRLPAPPGVDPSTLAAYHQTVDQWAAAVHDVDNKVAANNIFQAPSAVNHLEQVAGNLEQQTANLHLSP